MVSKVWCWKYCYFNPSGPPDPDFLHVNQKSRFLGEGGSRTAQIWDPDFVFGNCNWSIISIYGSVRVSLNKSPRAEKTTKMWWNIHIFWHNCWIWQCYRHYYGHTAFRKQFSILMSGSQKAKTYFQTLAEKRFLFGNFTLSLYEIFNIWHFQLIE